MDTIKENELCGRKDNNSAAEDSSPNSSRRSPHQKRMKANAKNKRVLKPQSRKFRRPPSYNAPRLSYANYTLPPPPVPPPADNGDDSGNNIAPNSCYEMRRTKSEPCAITKTRSANGFGKNNNNNGVISLKVFRPSPGGATRVNSTRKTRPMECDAVKLFPMSFDISNPDIGTLPKVQQQQLRAAIGRRSNGNRTGVDNPGLKQQNPSKTKRLRRTASKVDYERADSDVHYLRQRGSAAFLHYDKQQSEYEQMNTATTQAHLASSDDKSLFRSTDDTVKPQKCSKMSGDREGIVSTLKTVNSALPQHKVQAVTSINSNLPLKNMVKEASGTYRVISTDSESSELTSEKLHGNALAKKSATESIESQSGDLPASSYDPQLISFSSNGGDCYIKTNLVMCIRDRSACERFGTNGSSEMITSPKKERDVSDRNPKCPLGFYLHAQTKENADCSNQHIDQTCTASNKNSDSCSSFNSPTALSEEEQRFVGTTVRDLYCAGTPKPKEYCKMTDDYRNNKDECVGILDSSDKQSPDVRGHLPKSKGHGERFHRRCKLILNAILIVSSFLAVTFAILFGLCITGVIRFDTKQTTDEKGIYHPAISATEHYTATERSKSHYTTSSNPRIFHQSTSERSKIFKFSETPHREVTFKKESDRNQNDVILSSTSEITSVNITSNDSVLNVTKDDGDDDDYVSVTSPFPVAPPVPTVALKKSKQKVSTEQYSTKHVLLTTSNDFHIATTQTNTSPQSSTSSTSRTLSSAAPSSRRKSKKGRRKKNRMNKNGNEESGSKERRRHQTSSSSLSNESKIKTRTSKNSPANDDSITKEDNTLLELNNPAKSHNDTSDEQNYNAVKKQSKQYRKALEYSELMMPHRESSTRNQEDSALFLSEDFLGNDNDQTLRDDDAVYYGVDDAFEIWEDQDDEDIIDDSPNQEETSCIRIPNSRCEESLPYSFTPFRRKLTEDERVSDKLNNVMRVLMRVFGLTRLPIEAMPKKENVAGRKRMSHNSARSMLNPREVKTGRREENCDMEAALVFVCYLIYPPCDDLHNFTAEESVDSRYDCNQWCSTTLSSCLDISTLSVLEHDIFMKPQNGIASDKPAGILARRRQYRNLVNTGILGLDTGGILQDTFPGILNGMESLPSFSERVPENTVGKGTIAKKICLQIFADKDIEDSFGNVSKNSQCSSLVRDLEEEDVSEENLTGDITNEEEDGLYDKTVCDEGYFQCKNDLCLDKEWTCDGQNDCGEWEDEIGCGCEKNQFQCGNGQCVSGDIVCDGYQDCMDRSDERNCSYCEPGLFFCDDMRQCVLSSWRCDGDVDCDNGEDERKCSCESRGLTSCELNELCIPNNFICDGEGDCLGGTDERDCDQNTKRCATWEFSCGSLCVPVKAMCDGIRDCVLGEDEEGCGKCEAVQLDACRETAYNVTSSPNFLRHQSQMKTAMSSEYVLFSLIVHTRCHPLLRHLGCSILAPPPSIQMGKGYQCPLNTSTESKYSPPRLLPCRELCETVRSSCIGILNSLSLTWPPFLSCQSFPPENSPKTSDASKQTKICLDFETIERGSCSAGEFLCSSNISQGSSKCIPMTSRCDGIRQCDDGSDEVNCDCQRLGRFACGVSDRCIPVHWRCDGHIDCPNGMDEYDCDKCNATQKPCDDYSCVPSSSWCDGLPDCPDGSDEEKCIKLIPRHHMRRFIRNPRSLRVDWTRNDPSGVLIGWHQGSWFPLCADDWTSLLSHLACHQMLYSDASDVTTIHYKEAINHALHVSKNQRNSKVQGEFNKRTSVCTGNQLIHLTCSPNSCGKKITLRPSENSYPSPYSLSYGVSARVLGGRTARFESWPWIASLTLPGMRHICGSTLIHPQWLLSAAHCFQGRDDEKYWRAKFGIVNRKDKNMDEKMAANITRIIIHPRFDSRSMDFDVALIKLDRVLAPDDGISPMCLPTAPTRPGAYCHIAGWGLTGKSFRGSNKLQEGAVHVTDRATCKRYYPKNDVTNRMICAGQQAGLVDACSGDSGGPLTCWQPQLRQWNLVGVTSWGSACKPHGTPGVYTDIYYMSKWIRKIIDQDIG